MDRIAARCAGKTAETLAFFRESPIMDNI